MNGTSINIRKLAKLTDCSPSTVSRVLSGRTNSIKISEETRNRILEACKRFDYHPSIHAERLFSKRSRVIGFLVALNAMWEDDNLSRSMYGVYDALFKAGYRTLPLVLDQAFQEKREYLEIFNRREVDGLIIWGAREGQAFLDELAEAKKPFMLLTNTVGNLPSVSSDQRKAVADLVGLCRKRGATRFAGVMNRSGASLLSRESGFLDAVAGVESKVFLASQDTACGYEIAKDILPFRPDAIICGNDETAVGVERYLLQQGINIPRDIMLTGGDNIKLSEYCQIPLTTFDQQAVSCATRCVATLVAHLDKGTPLESALLPAPIIERMSTART